MSRADTTAYFSQVVRQKPIQFANCASKRMYKLRAGPTIRHGLTKPIDTLDNTLLQSFVNVVEIIRACRCPVELLRRAWFKKSRCVMKNYRQEWTTGHRIGRRYLITLQRKRTHAHHYITFVYPALPAHKTTRVRRMNPFKFL